MADEVKVEGQEQKPDFTNGRVANVDEAVRQQQAKQYLNNEDDKEIEAEKAAEEAAKKAKEEEAKAKGEEKPKEEGKKDDEEQTWDGKDYVDTGIESADAVIAILKDAKVDPLLANSIFEKAMQTKNMDDVRWDVLAKHLSAPQLALVKAGVKDTLNGAVKVIAETTEFAHELVGGADNWTKVIAWAKAEAGKNPQWAKQYEGYKQGVDHGGPVAQLALKAVKEAYEASNGTIGKAVVRGEKQHGTTEQVTGLTRTEYYAERSKLEREGKATEANIKALFARRQAGMAQGI